MRGLQSSSFSGPPGILFLYRVLDEFYLDYPPRKHLGDNEGDVAFLDIDALPGVRNVPEAFNNQSPKALI